jgi:hypothetical protein
VVAFIGRIIKKVRFALSVILRRVVVVNALFKKILVFAVPKIIILFLAFIGLVHLWYNVNYCEVTFKDSLKWEGAFNESFNNTVYANFEQLTYFFNETHGQLIIPQGTRMRCGLDVQHLKDQ